MVLTLAAVAWTGMAVTGGTLGGPGAIILGGGLALSTTAVGMQVCVVMRCMCLQG